MENGFAFFVLFASAAFPRNSIRVQMNGPFVACTPYAMSNCNSAMTVSDPVNRVLSPDVLQDETLAWT
jgi:hypothetical protein